MAQAWREVINPADPTQRYVLWDNGRIDAVGGALPITGLPTFFNTVPPAGYAGPARALQITDWSGPSGYFVDWVGNVTAFGSATPPGSQAVGVPFAFPIVIDFYMNPTANGQGYLLGVGGGVEEFGGATAVAQPTAVNINTGQQYIRILFETFGGRYYALTSWGAIVAVGGAGAITTVDNVSHVLSTTAPFWPSWSIAKAIRFYDFVNGKGWMLDGWGGIHNLNGAEVVFGQGQVNVNYWPSWDIARDLNLIDDGTGPDPLTTLTLDGLGPDHTIVVSTAPTVTVSMPANGSTVTNTTRPRIGWNYSDPEGDAQATYDVKVFSSAQYGAGGFSPDTSTPTYEVSAASETVFFTDPVFDFPNGTWRAYVRASDTSGLFSPWAFSQWTENVTPPPTPTVTPTAGVNALDGISVLIHSTSPPAGTFYGLQYQDSDRPTDPWRWVRGRVAGVTRDAVGLVPDGSGNATVIDDEAAFGVLRIYRAISYKNPTGDIIVSPFSTVATAKLQDLTAWTLTNPTDSTLGGKIHLVPDTFKIARPIVGSAFQPSGRRNAIVFTDGGPKGAVGDLQLILPALADHTMFQALLESGDTLLLRDPYSRRWYIQPTYDTGGHLRGVTGGVAAWTDALQFVPPDCGEVGPPAAGFVNHDTAPIVEVDRPLAGPASGVLALLG